MSTIESRRAYRVYLLLSGASSLFYSLVFTVNMVYFVTDLRLTPLELVLVGTTLEAAVFLFEVPTGIVADVYSRRLSIIIGMVLLGIAFVIMGAVPTYAAVLLTQVIWGIGYTFTSGATEAWLADEIGEEHVGEAFVRGSQAASVGNIIGIIGSVALAALLQINVPMVLGGLCFLLLGLSLRLFMPETGFQRAAEADRSSWREMFSTFRAGVALVRLRPILITILVIGVIHGVASEGYDRLWQKHLIDTITLPGDFPVILWFGVIDLVGIVIGLGMKEIARRRVDFNSPRAVALAVMLINLGIAGGIFILALSSNLVIALLMLWVIGPLRGAVHPIFTAWINQSLEPRVRATILSMSGQVDALGQVVGGPVVGGGGQPGIGAGGLGRERHHLGWGDPVVPAVAAVFARGCTIDKLKT